MIVVFNKATGDISIFTFASLFRVPTLLSPASNTEALRKRCALLLDYSAELYTNTDPADSVCIVTQTGHCEGNPRMQVVGVGSIFRYVYDISSAC